MAAGEKSAEDKGKAAFAKLCNGYALEEMARAEGKRIAAMQMSKAAGWGEDIDVFGMPAPDPPTTLNAVGQGFVIVAGTTTVMYGSRASGKTWVAAAWAAQELRAGAHVLWIDFENQAQLTGEKLRSMLPAGVAKTLHYRTVKGAPDYETLAAEIQGWGRTLVVIDAFRGLQSAVAPGTGANDGDAVELINSGLLVPLAAAGASVCVIDHRPKSGDSAFGSERKESMADVVIKVEQSAAFARDKSGFSTVTVTKDRYGWRAEGSPAGFLWMPSALDPQKDYPDVPEIRSWAPMADGNLAAMNAQRADSKEQRVVTTIEIIREHPDEFRSRKDYVAWARANDPETFATQWEAEQAFKYAVDGGKIKKYARGYRVADEADGTKALVTQLNGGDDG